MKRVIGPSEGRIRPRDNFGAPAGSAITGETSTRCSRSASTPRSFTDRTWTAWDAAVSQSRLLWPRATLKGELFDFGAALPVFDIEADGSATDPLPRAFSSGMCRGFGLTNVLGASGLPITVASHRE